MKIAVTLKDPDTMQDSVDDAVKRLPKPEGVSAAEWVDIREDRAAAVKAAISSAFMRYGEYLDVEFTVDDECSAVEVRVLPAR